MTLSRWGYRPEHAHAMANAGADLLPARVARHDRTGYLVVLPDRGPPDDPEEAFARIPGHLRRDPPAVGDWVALDLRDPPTIRVVLPRTTRLARKAAGREEREQVLAANVDVLFIVLPSDALRRTTLDRYLVLAASSGARPVVVVNKTDLAPPPTDLGTPLLATSALTGEGIETLRGLVPPGVTAALLGPSGVGKSSLVNALLGEERLETGEVRRSDHKGRHTTTARHLLPLPAGGILLDTPGMRELGLWDADEAVSTVFADVEAAAARCRFRDCRHESEPGCAVLATVPPERLASWRKLQREAESAARRADVAADRRAAREWGKMAKRTVAGKRERLRDDHG